MYRGARRGSSGPSPLRSTRTAATSTSPGATRQVRRPDAFYFESSQSLVQTDRPPKRGPPKLYPANLEGEAEKATSRKAERLTATSTTANTNKSSWLGLLFDCDAVMQASTARWVDVRVIHAGPGGTEAVQYMNVRIWSPPQNFSTTLYACGVQFFLLHGKAGAQGGPRTQNPVYSGCVDDQALWIEAVPASATLTSVVATMLREHYRRVAPPAAPASSSAPPPLPVTTYPPSPPCTLHDLLHHTANVTMGTVCVQVVRLITALSAPLGEEDPSCTIKLRAVVVRDASLPRGTGVMLALDHGDVNHANHWRVQAWYEISHVFATGPGDVLITSARAAKDRPPSYLLRSGGHPSELGQAMLRIASGVPSTRRGPFPSSSSMPLPSVSTPGAVLTVAALASALASSMIDTMFTVRAVLCDIRFVNGTLLSTLPREHVVKDVGLMRDLLVSCRSAFQPLTFVLTDRDGVFPVHVNVPPGLVGEFFAKIKGVHGPDQVLDSERGVVVEVLALDRLLREHVSPAGRQEERLWRLSCRGGARRVWAQFDVLGWDFER